jgi:hypothetical protein
MKKNVRDTFQRFIAMALTTSLSIIGLQVLSES